MQRLSRRPLLIAAVSLSGMTSLTVAVRVLGGSSPDTALLSLYWFVMTLLIIAWLLAEPGVPADYRPSFDHGYLHWAVFPILALHEQFVSRGWLGIARVLGLLMLLIAPYLAWGVVFVFA